MGIEIRSTSLQDKPLMEFPISFVNLDELIPHEQTIEHELKWFIDSLLETKAIFWPLLVDRDSKLILDGHHRTAGLKQLGYTKAPCILIDYEDDELITLDTWYPLINGNVTDVIDSLGHKSLEITKVDKYDYDPSRLENREITAYIGNSEVLYEIKGEREQIFQILRNTWIEQITYYDNKDHCLSQASQDQTAVIAWAYTKQEILDHVKLGIVHLPKTTRHELKYRIPKCNVPIEKLR